MPAKSPRSGYVLTSEDARKGGRNSKRGPSIKIQIQKLLSNQTPPNIKSEVESSGLRMSDGTLDEALALRLMAAALSGESWAHKLLLEFTEKRPAQVIEVEGGLDIASRVAEARSKFQKKTGQKKTSQR